ncbi:MAG: aminotransferase class IV [Corynebacterium sp.]|nr:aminotransferase class IV [Corynebacterium sp.]
MELVTSFAVRDGRAIRPDLHWERLGIAASSILDAEHSLLPRLFANLWVPPVGNYFPYFSAYHGTTAVPATRYLLRPQPPLRTETRLWLCTDERSFPHLKGPDMAVQAAARREAWQFGAHDAVFIHDATIREAANAALLFELPDTGLIQAPASVVVDSVTVRAAIAAGLLLRPQRRTISVAEALDLPAMCASSLHGFTPVTAWVTSAGVISAPTPTINCAELNEALWASAAPFQTIER